MNHYADKAYLHAKIFALHNQLLRRNDYFEIINAKKAHLAFPGLISETDARDHIKVKEIIFRNQIQKILVLIKASSHYMELFRAFLRSFEANNFKLLLARASGRETVIEQWYDISPHNEFDKDLLSRDISLDEFKTLLANTCLKAVITDGFSLKYEVIESRIDFSAAAHFLDFSKKILFSQRRIFNEIMLRRIVLFKIVWTRRLKENYGWDDDRIMGYMTSLYDLIHEFKGEEKLISDIERQMQKELDERLGTRESSGVVPEISDIENELEKYFRSYVWTMFSKDFHSIYCVVSYLWLLYYQIQNLFRIVEGFRFNVSPEILHKKIICEG